MQSPNTNPAICIPAPDNKAVEERSELRLLRGTQKRAHEPQNEVGNSRAEKSVVQDSGTAWTPEPFVEAEAAAEFLHYSTRSIKQMARDGRIPAHPFGSGPRKRWYFLISELAEQLRARVNCEHGAAGRDKTQRRVI